MYFYLLVISFSSYVSAAEKIETIKVTPIDSLKPMLLGLGGILLLIFILAMLIKKVTGLNIVSNNIKVIESQSLGAKEKLVIVEIQQQQYVIGVTAHSINQICQLQEKIVKQQPSLSFDKIMKQFIQPNKNSDNRATDIKAKFNLGSKTNSTDCEVG